MSIQLPDETSIVFEPIGNTGSVKAKLVHKWNDPYVNVHYRIMLQHWRANVDIQIIFDAHAAITDMTKYAAKGEKAGKSLQSIVKSVIQMADSDMSISALVPENEAGRAVRLLHDTFGLGV